MTDKPELPKVDFKSLLGQIKSVIGSGTEAPQPVDSDLLGKSMERVSTLSKQLAEGQANLTQNMHELHEEVNQLYAMLEEFRQQNPGCVEVKPTAKKATAASKSKKSSK